MRRYFALSEIDGRCDLCPALFLSDAEIPVLIEYAGNGGGVVAGAIGWIWQGNNGTGDLAEVLWATGSLHPRASSGRSTIFRKLPKKVTPLFRHRNSLTRARLSTLR